MVITLGYDPVKQRYVGTWVGTMMSHLRIYEGSLDAAEKVLTLNTEGPNCTGDGQLAKYKDIIEIKSDDHRVLTSHTLGDDGRIAPGLDIRQFPALRQVLKSALSLSDTACGAIFPPLALLRVDCWIILWILANEGFFSGFSVSRNIFVG